MASAFNLTAQLNLVGPTNVGVIIADIRRQLGTINGNIKFQIDPSAIANTARLNRGLLTLNSTLDQTGVSARNAVSAIRDLGKAVTSIGGANSAAQAINNAAKATSSLNNTCQQAAAGARGAGSEMQEFGKQAGLAVRRFSAFSIVTSAIFAVTGAMKQGIAAFIEFDQQFVKLRQVTGESTEGLKGLASTITSLSTGLGASSAELTNVASTLAQAGLSARDTERALKALALSSLAPSFSDMNQTVEGSIALMRQFGISAKDLESSLGAINSVSAKFAVESRDIIAAIQRTGGVFASASRGVSEGKDALNEFIAVFTSVRATTRESAETIATGLRTIFTRIQRGGTIEALKEYGVNLTDLDGKFVGAYKAVQLLSEGLNSIDPRDLKFSEIIEQLGGFRQIGKVIPLIQQFATTQDALKVAQQGQGSLAKDAALAQLSLANQVSKVREEFLALFREIGGSDTFQTMAKGALSVASAIIKVADSMKGVLPVLAALIAMKGASAIFQFGTGFAQGVGRSGGARGLGSRVGGGGMAQGGVIRAFARGGVVPGSGSGDTVPAMLEPGEFVIRKKAVQSLGSGNLHRMNKSGGGKINGYASGGKVHKFAGGGKFTVDQLMSSQGNTIGQSLKPGSHLEKNDIVTANIIDSTLDNGALSPTEIGVIYKKKKIDRFKQLARDANGRKELVAAQKEKYIYDAKRSGGFNEPQMKEFGKEFGSAERLWGAGYEEIIRKRYSLHSASNNKAYPVDTINPTQTINGDYNWGEIKFKTTKEPKAKLVAKLLAQRINENSIDKYFLEGEIKKKDDTNLGNLEYYSGIQKGQSSHKLQFYQGMEIGGEVSPTLVGVPDNLAKAKAFQATTASDVAKKFLRKKLPNDSAFAQYSGAEITNDLIKSAWRTDTKLPNIKNYLQEGMAKDAAGIKEAKDQEIAKSYKFGLVGLAPLGYSDTIGPQALSKTSSTIFAKGLPKAYEKAIEGMREKLGGAVNSFATDIQTTGITSGNKNIALDFDETLFGGADLFDKNGKIDIEGYSDLNRVMSGLNKGHITPLGSKIKELIGLDPSFLNRLSVLTARPQSNAGLLAAKLNEIGIPIPITKIVGTSGGGSRKADAMTKAQKLVDDNLENIKAVRGRGLEGVAYAPVKGLTEDQKKAAGFAGAEGNILEATLAALGATGGSIQSRAVDYEHGLGVTAAQYFPGLNPAWPTEVKRTINGDSISDAKEQFTKWLKAKGMARGGKVDFEKGVGESPFSKASSSNKLGQAAYALQKNSGLNDLEFNNIKQFADSAGYNLEEFKTYLAKRIEQKRSKAGLRSDGASLLESLKIPAKTSTNSQLALAAQLQQGTTPAGYAAGGAISDTVPAMLTPGEFVINKKAAKNIGYGKLRRMNHADKVQGFASGGAVGDYEFSDSISKSSPAAEAAMDNLLAKLVAQITKAAPSISFDDAHQMATEQTVGTVNFGSKVAADAGDQKAAKAVYEAQRKQVVAITKDIRSMDKSITIADARIAAEAKVSEAWGGLMQKVKSTPAPKGPMPAPGPGPAPIPGPVPGLGTPTDAEKTEALDRKRARRQMIGMGVGMAIPLATSMFTTDKPQSESEARTNAVVSGASSSFGAASALMGQGKLGMVAGVGVAVYGVVQALADAENAANEFAKTQASSKLEAANEKATASLELFGKNLKDGALSIKATSDVLATIKAADTLASTKDRTYRGIANLKDTGEGSAQRGDILKREGIFSYLQTTSLFAGSETQANTNLAMKSEKYIPEISKEKAKDYSSASQVSALLLESKIKSGESIANLKQQPDFDNLIKSLALADSAVQADILNTQNRTDLGQAEKTDIKNAIVSRVAENKAREIQTRVLREKAIENLNKSANTLSNSLERMFQTMEQSINKSSFHIERLGNQADLTSAALSGTAKIGSTQLNAINVLQNPRVSSSRESNDAIKLASSAYGSEANNMAGIMKLALSLEDTMMKSINSTLKATNKSDTNEAVGAKLESAIAESIANLQLPPDLSSKLAAEVGASIAEIRKSGDSNLDFSQLIEKIPMLGKVIESSKRSFEAAIKVLEHWQKAFTEYSNSLNKVIDIQIDSANRLRTANALVFNGLLELNKAFGRTASLATMQRSVSLTTQSMTGGATAPSDIGRNISGLENQRKAQQGASDAASAVKDMDGFKLFQNNLVKTSVALRQNYDALKYLSESTVVAGAAMAKISELQQKNQAGVNIVEKLVTSSPEDLQNLNRSMIMLSNNMQGRVNLGSTAEDRKGSLDAFQMIAPLLGENQNKMKANVLQAMLQESGMGNNPMMNDILASLRDPAVDPAMAEAISIYRDSLRVQGEAHAELIKLNSFNAENTAQIAAEQLKTALQNTPLMFENKQLVEIADGIKSLVKLGGVPGVQPQVIAAGGLIYASGGQKVDFKPQGTDTVPAMLTPGEFVINKAATSKNLPLLKSINGGFSQGGSVGYYSDGGYIFGNRWHHADKNDAVRQAKTPDKETATGYAKINDLKIFPSDPAKTYKSAPSDLFVATDSPSTEGDLIKKGMTPTIGVPFKNMAGYGYDAATTSRVTGNGPVTGYNESYQAGISDSLTLPPASLADNIDFVGKAPIKQSEKDEYLTYYKDIQAKYFNPMGDVKAESDKIISNSKTIYLDPQKYAQNQPPLDPRIRDYNPLDLQMLYGLSRRGIDTDLLGLYDLGSTSPRPPLLTRTQLPKETDGSTNVLGFAQTSYYRDPTAYEVVSGRQNMKRNDNSETPHAGSQDAYRLKSSSDINIGTINKDVENKGKLSENIKRLEVDKFASKTSESNLNIDFINKLRNLYNKVSLVEKFDSKEINNVRAGVEPTSLYNIGEKEWDKIIKQMGVNASVKYATDPRDWVDIYPALNSGYGSSRSEKFPWASPGIDKDSLEEYQKSFDKRNLIKIDSKTYDRDGVLFGYKNFTGPLYDQNRRFFDQSKTETFSIIPEGGGAQAKDVSDNPFAEGLRGKDIIQHGGLNEVQLENTIKKGRANWETQTWGAKKKISGVTGYDENTTGYAYPTGASELISGLTAPKFFDAYDQRKVDAQNQDDAKSAEEQQVRGFKAGGPNVGSLMAGIRNLNSVKGIIQQTVGSQMGPIRGAGFKLYPLTNIEKLGTYASDLIKLQTVFGQKVKTKKDKSGKTIGVNEAQAKAWGVIGAASQAFTKISSKDFLGLSSLLNLNTKDFENRNTTHKIDALSSGINKYGEVLSSSAIYKMYGQMNGTSGSVLDQELEDTDQKKIDRMFADKAQSDQMRMGNVDPKSGKVTYKPINADNSPKTLQTLGKLALNPYATFGVGQRDALLRTLSNSLFDKDKNAYRAMQPDLAAMSTWLINQDAIINGTDKGLSASLLNDPRRYEQTALALRRLALDDLGILPDFAKIQEMKASYAIDKKPQTVASGGMIYASGGQMIDFSPKGTDTVPAMLTPGEFVINKAATAKNLPLLQSINRNAGGMVYLAQGGLAHLDGGGEASRYSAKDVARLLKIGDRVARRTGWTLQTNNNADTTLGLPDVTNEEFKSGQKRRPEIDSDEERGLKVYQESQLKKQERATENSAIAKDEAARKEREDLKAHAKIESDKYKQTKAEVDAKQAKRELETQQSNKEKEKAFDAKTERMKAGWAASANKREEAERLRQEQKDARTAEVAVLSKQREDATNARNRIAREAKEEAEAVMADKRAVAENSYHIDPVTRKMYETASGAFINQQKVAQDILALQKATNNGNIGKKPKVHEATYSDGSRKGADALADWKIAAKKKQELADLLITQGGMNMTRTSFDADLAQYIASTDADYKKYKELYEANKLKPNQALDYSMMGLRRGVNPNQLPAGAQASSRLRENLDAKNIKRIAEAEHNKVKQDIRNERAKGPQYNRFMPALANKAGTSVAGGLAPYIGEDVATALGAATNVGVNALGILMDPTNIALMMGGLGLAGRGAPSASLNRVRAQKYLVPPKYGEAPINVGSTSLAQVEQVGAHVPSGTLPKLKLPSIHDPKTGRFSRGDGTSQSILRPRSGSQAEEVGLNHQNLWNSARPNFQRDSGLPKESPKTLMGRILDYIKGTGSPKPRMPIQDYPTPYGSPNKPIRPIQDYPADIRGSIRKGKRFERTTYAAKGQMINFEPKGTDTVPAMLTPGEFVVNKAATSKNLPLLQSINRNAGGMAYLAAGGLAHLSPGGEASKYSEKEAARLLAIGERVAERTGWTLATQNDKDPQGLPPVSAAELSAGQKRPPVIGSDEGLGLRVYQESQAKLRQAKYQANREGNNQIVARERAKHNKYISDTETEYQTLKNLYEAHQLSSSQVLNYSTMRLRRGLSLEKLPSENKIDSMLKAKGGMIYASEGQLINFQPRGTDTVPAMLTPGEFVINKAATAKNLPLLQSINRNAGGVAYLQKGGESTEYDLRKKALQEQFKKDHPSSKERKVLLEELRAEIDRISGQTFNPSKDPDLATKRDGLLKRLIDEKQTTLKDLGEEYDRHSEIWEQNLSNLKKLTEIRGRRPPPTEKDLLRIQQLEILNTGNKQMIDEFWTQVISLRGLPKDRAKWIDEVAPPQPKARGGMVYANNGSLISARSQSSIDSIPAMLTPGEFVVNKKATQQNLPTLQRLNSGGVVSPNYYGVGDLVSKGGSGGSSSGIGDLNGALSQFTASLTKFLDAYSVASKAKNLPMATSRKVSPDGVKIDYEAIGAFTAKLANIAQALGALDKIPDHITISGTHSVEVIINGDEALNRLSPGVQEIVTTSINAAMKKLVDDNPSLQGSVDVPTQT